MSTVKNSEARKRVVAARTDLLLDEPFFGTLALRLNLVEDYTAIEPMSNSPSMWVDGKTLGYHPDFVMSLQYRELITALMHEVMHCAAGHPWRREGRDLQRWNEAADRAINPTLRDGGYHLPKGALLELEPTHAGKSAEWIFDRLPKPQPQQGSGNGSQSKQDAPQQQGSNDQGQGSGQGQPQPKGSGKPSDKAPKGGAGNAPGRPQDGPDGGPAGDTSPDPRSSGPGHPEKNAAVPNGARKPADHKPDGLGEVRDAPSGTEDDPAPSEEEWQAAVQQAAVMAQKQGKLPASLKRFAKDAVKPRVDWRAAVLRYAQERARADYSFARPNPRYVAHAMYLPALYNHEVGILAVGVDTSGSVDDVLLSQYQAEIREIADEIRPREIRVLYADARVHSVEVFERGDDVVLHPTGGGGTDFRPVFTTIESWDEQPVCLIYLTDLIGTFPEKAPEVPTLWVTGAAGPSRPVPFGEFVAAA